MAPARAASADAVPAVIHWHSTELRSLAEDPLRLLLHRETASVRAEWAPLYRDARGGHYEWTRQDYEWQRKRRSATVGLSVLSERISVRGEERSWSMASESGGPPRIALLGGDRVGPLAFVAAAGAGPGWNPGFSLAASVERGPGGHADFAWTRWAARGRYDARYTDTRVLAEAHWLDQRVECGLRGPTAAGDVELRVASLDHIAGGRGGDSRDAVEPILGWRSVLVSWAPRVRSGRGVVRLEHGLGRSGFSARRDGAGFAGAGGAVRNDLASAQWRPERSSWTARGWAGRWLSEPGGALSTWPFAELTLLTGTRRYASSTASLGHAGLSFDRTATDGRWEAGLSTLWVRPRFSYESWQGTLFGLGRDDVTTGSLRIESAWLAGLRLSASLPLGRSLAGVEVVQWLPVVVSRIPSGTSGGGGPSGGGARAGHGAWGGTLIRTSLKIR